MMKRISTGRPAGTAWIGLMGVALFLTAAFSVAADDIGDIPRLPSLREQAEIRQGWLMKRLETVLPALMRENHVDMWHSVELYAMAEVPEWGNQKVRIALEEDAAMNADGSMEWILRRQNEYHLVK